MARIENTPVCFVAKEGQQTTAQLQSTHYDPRDRLKRALLKLGLFWLLAAVSVFIIFAHWVLVPAFFLAGPWMAWRTYHIESVRNHAKGECPACHQPAEIKLEADDTLPKWTYCPLCNAPLQIIEARA